MRRWLASLLVASFVSPRSAARMVLQQNFSNADIFGLAALVAIALTIANWILGQIAFTDGDPVQEFIKSQPLLAAIFQLIGIPLGASISLGLSRLFGGKGSFRNTMIVFIWLNAAMACVQMAFLLLLPLVAPIVAPLGLIALAWALFAHASGLVEIHGFSNVYAVIAVIVALAIVFVLAIAELASALGLLLPSSF
jgi:hypothetical protein